MTLYFFNGYAQLKDISITDISIKAYAFHHKKIYKLQTSSNAYFEKKKILLPLKSS